MNKILLIALGALLCSCATYPTAQKVALVSFDDNPTKGKSVGNIRGQDCTWKVLGYQLGGLPTVDKAFMNARSGTDGGSLMSGINGGGKSSYGGDLKYVNNVSTSNEGFDAVVVGKTCIVVTGIGYK